MTIDLDSGAGLFDRLGRMAYVASIANTWRGTTLPAEIEDAVEEFDAATTTVRDAAVPTLLAALKSAQSGLGSLNTAMRTAARGTLLQMVNADNPQPSITSIEQALMEVVRQMQQAVTRYVDPVVVSCTVTRTGLDGDGVCVTSTKSPTNSGGGLGLDNLIAEDLECQVTGVATAGSETILVRGEEAVDPLHWEWPNGSGANRTYTAIDAAGTTHNKLTNSDFEDWTAAALDSWTAVVGAYGTNIVKETVEKYKGTNGVALVGDAGATLAQIRQDITTKLSARKQYAVNLWLKRDGTPAAAGVLTVDLFDGTNVINDEGGTANSFTIDLTALTTSFVAYNAAFRIPEPKPSTIYVRLRLSTALTNGRTVYLDHLALGEMFQPLSSVPGWTPYLAFFSGATNWTRDDQTQGARVFKIAVANNRASDWQAWFDRFFETSRYGITLPSSGTTLIPDALIG